ncbi:nuclear transport factor 2 family protein [Actinomadura rudentiformis]|uniref:Nuclear transport factor 2 family protein n=1 Tax=Actinomadura rudentiformis TaxID=359158 RepID=A0A6H9Z9Y7_9ACTN|nr:nuclear transport factor 2 family protein [Actinomadura rudentiformis]KAB2352253.1 nuclear transport factor 2 family protein [Actinomadura rudentiformis]
MTASTLAASYLAALERGDLEGVLALFHPEAIVHSPLYGPSPAVEFYPRLLADTGRSELHLRGVTQGERLVGVWFHFDWTLPSGTAAGFECVDMLELDEEGLITNLRIFYDTVTTRTAFERETGGSWRPTT